MQSRFLKIGSYKPAAVVLLLMHKFDNHQMSSHLPVSHVLTDFGRKEQKKCVIKKRHLFYTEYTRYASASNNVTLRQKQLDFL